MKNILSHKIVIYSLFAAGGLLLGWMIFHSSEIKETRQDEKLHSIAEITWTCSMHPQIRMEEAGKCPICAMELIPLNQNAGFADSDAIHLTKEAIALANVQTSIVSRQEPIAETRLYGKIQADERLLQSQVSHVSGRIDKLLVNFTGEEVKKGQTLAQIYSPELVTAQQELLETYVIRQSQPEIYEAAKERLRQWNLTETQISEIESTGKTKSSFELVSNTSGIVMSRKVNVGDYVSQGSGLYEIADLSNVWVLFDAYESDLQFLSKGEKLSFTVQALPGKTFKGSIVFIDQVIDPVTRVAKVRVEISNQQRILKPEMFAIGLIRSNLKEYGNSFIIPRSSVLWTGKRSVVYVKQSNTSDPTFKMREIELGPKLGNSYVVMSGLSEGEGGEETSESKKEEQIQLSSLLKKETIVASGKCGMCKERIETAAKSVKGVLVADYDLKTNKLRLEFDSLTKIEDVHKAIALAGHDTDKMKADDETYSNLPECCLYRK